MKRSELLFNVFLVPVDILAIIAAGTSSFYLRIFAESWVGPIIYQLPFGEFAVILLQAIVVLILVFASLGLYNLPSTRRFTYQCKQVILGITFGLLLVIVLFFFNQSLFPSRFIILSAWALGIVFVLIARFAVKLLQEWSFRRGIGLHRVVIINGDTEQAKKIEQYLRRPWHGYKVIAELAMSEKTTHELESLYHERGFDEIIHTNASNSDVDNLQLVEFARGKGLQFSFVPNLFDVQRNVVEFNNLQGVNIITLRNTPLDGWGKVAKRVFDIVVSSMCLILTSPLFLFFAIAIKLDSPGKVIYAALRGGRGKDFWFYKFRSMYSHLSVGEGYGGEEAEKVRQELWKNNDRGGADGPFLKIKNDPRVTRMGRILRKTKLDEIPQFWNVLKGDMSMVGPRAHVLDEVDRYRNRYRRMFSIKPGIFGVSQIAQMGWPDLPFEEEIRLNTYYIENWSLWWDVKILAITFYKLFFERKPREDY
jgi:exopolysaccharide biosynthesis polyprenyl glycosylphosphotransferase